MRKSIFNTGVKVALTMVVFLVSFTLTAQGPFEKGRSFRDDVVREKHDTLTYFVLSMNVFLDGKQVEDDSILVYVRVMDSKSGIRFDATEKTELLLSWDNFYEVWVTKRGYSRNYFRVSRFLKRDWKTEINIYLESGNNNYDVGAIGWDSVEKIPVYVPTKFLYK